MQSAKTMKTVESSVTKENKASSLLDSFLEVEEIIGDTIEEGKVLESDIANILESIRTTQMRLVHIPGLLLMTIPYLL